ncbi:competence type IV pilus minor pilin ComGF [Bacillus suaedaesalsae]|uniref:ComGF family competence protein n=1 Tax=Bacillus suaedaesalsae TaxID=2810349 RepID=A0ABS2DFN9_9BACI|nr:competence type IV pilus minor pilin ComGF [Bacillus suaedaesalsae]MBM6617304.1 ComGF family competence protein [Bacillus suaedaesalsae]
MDQFISKRESRLWHRKINQNGYTILEMLIVFFILLTITFLFPQLFIQLTKWIEKPTSLHPFEWEVAISQITMDIREAEAIEIENNRLKLINSDVILYEQYGKLVRRRVNNQGHEIILQQIQSIQFYYTTGGIEIEVEDLEGKMYERKIYTWTNNAI